MHYIQYGSTSLRTVHFGMLQASICYNWVHCIKVLLIHFIWSNCDLFVYSGSVNSDFWQTRTTFSTSLNSGLTEFYCTVLDMFVHTFLHLPASLRSLMQILKHAKTYALPFCGTCYDSSCHVLFKSVMQICLCFVNTVTLHNKNSVI